MLQPERGGLDLRKVITQMESAHRQSAFIEGGEKAYIDMGDCFKATPNVGMRKGAVIRMNDER